MPVKVMSDDNGCYAKWGDAGHKYYYPCGNDSARKEAKQKAYLQGLASGEVKQKRTL
jgi:hypothetical protein